MASGPNVDLFDAYFRRADLDRDGRISGAEAVAFFQGSGLSKQVLAQIWAIANRSQSNFLGRAEFYNALKLVTVAQNKRELTHDIVNAALYSPASAKIPAPQINLAAVGSPTSQFNSSAAAPTSQLNSSTPVPAQVNSSTAVSTPQLNSSMTAPTQFNSSAATPTPSFNSSMAVPTQFSSSVAAPTQFNSSVAVPTQVGVVAPASAQNLGFRGPQVPPHAGVNQQHLSVQPSQLVRPPQSISASGSHPTQGVGFQGLPGGGTVTGPRPVNMGISNDWVGGVRGAASLGTSSQVPVSGMSPSITGDEFGVATAELPPRQQATPGIKPSGLAKDSQASTVSGNGFASDSIFGGDVFSATQSQPVPVSSSHTISANSVQASSTVVPTVVPVSAGTQPSARPNALDSLQNSVTRQPVGAQIQRPQSLENQIQKVSAQNTSASNSSGIALGADNSVSSQSQSVWPRMTPTNVQKYTKVFVEVDKDRDGKITGEEARNLFLSWRLPREILKQVWDLSDQDNDSMLSLREFCTALYLMERYREGRPLPAVLPESIKVDLPNPSQTMNNYGNTAWQPVPGFHHQQQQGMPSSGARHLPPAGAGKPPRPVPVHHTEGSQVNQQKPKVPVLEQHVVNQLSTEEQKSLNSKLQEVTEADKKVEELEKEILDSRQKIEFYRVQMQKLVLYKSKCDNRLNEITERTSADKREVESLAKKYEEKYKQSGDVASRLTIEESTFRDLQEKKMELYQAIVKMEQDGSADGVLQDRVDHIQSDLDELVKALNERCKKYGLRAKPTTLTELPFGWQPGIQEGAADWDEDWDKFEDEGFTFVKELTLDVQNTIAPPREKSKSVRNEKASTVESPSAVSSPNADIKSEKPQIMDEQAVENGSAYNKGEDYLAKSTPSSPAMRSMVESPTSESPYPNFDKASVTDVSPRDKDYQSDHGGTGSLFSGDKSFDEPNWGTFDANDDVDSVWGFNANSSFKDIDQERNGDNDFFGSGNFGLKPIRTESPHVGQNPIWTESPRVGLNPVWTESPRVGLNPVWTESPHAGSLFQKKSSFAFDDSVPSTPLFSSSNSPQKFDLSGPSFDNFSRFDSFSSTQDSGFFSSRETGARFDSVHSSRDLNQGHGFTSFDDSDPFGSGPFRTSLDSQTPRRTSDSWSAF